MTYSISVQLPNFGSLTVSGENVETVVKLLNSVTRKFFSVHPAAKIII